MWTMGTSLTGLDRVVGVWGKGSFALCGGATGELGARISPPAAVGPQECAEQGKPVCLSQDCGKS